MIPNRIEAYCNLKAFAYLHEFQGYIPLGVGVASNSSMRDGGSVPESNRIVVAEEIDGDGRIIRGWYVLLESVRDGRGFVHDPLEGRIVSRDIRPGIPTPNYDPYLLVELESVNEPELRLIKNMRDEMALARERHLIHAQTYLDALKRADDWRGNVEHLNTVVAAKDLEIAKRDDEIFELRNENGLNRQQLATLQASYLALVNRKSLKTQFKEWCRSWMRCVLRRVGLSG